MPLKREMTATHRLVNGISSLAFSAVDHVAVDVESERDGSVPGLLRDDIYGYSGCAIPTTCPGLPDLTGEPLLEEALPVAVHDVLDVGGLVATA